MLNRRAASGFSRGSKGRASGARRNERTGLRLRSRIGVCDSRPKSDSHRMTRRLFQPLPPQVTLRVCEFFDLQEHPHCRPEAASSARRACPEPRRRVETTVLLVKYGALSNPPSKSVARVGWIALWAAAPSSNRSSPALSDIQGSTHSVFRAFTWAELPRNA